VKSVNTPPSPPSPHGPARRPNLGTMVPGTELMKAWQQRARVRALSPSEAYTLAVAADRIREPQAEVGYRLYWMGDSVMGSTDVVAQPSGYVVIGRHESCDLVIDADERIVSLRHVLVRAASLDDGFPVLSLLDLQTSAGFELSDGSKQRSVAATGPVVFRVGEHSFVALPSAGRYPDALPVPFVERGELAPHRLAPKPIMNLAVPEIHGPPPSRITVLPYSVDLSARRSSVPVVSYEPHVPTGEGYEVILETQQRRVGVVLSKADLDHGVLIGRSDKCVDEGLRSILGGTISRVHILLIREKGACHLYDVASLVGTYVRGRRIRCLELNDVGSVVHLASSAGVLLHWRAL
jgi:hypothetical protein